MFGSEIPEAEKIDRTYKMLLANRRWRWIGIFLRIAIIWGLYFGYQYIQRPENIELKQAILQQVRTKLSEFITPIVQDLVGDVLKNMELPTASWSSSNRGTSEVSTGNRPEITPEMIEAVRNSMQK